MPPAPRGLFGEHRHVGGARHHRAQAGELALRRRAAELEDLLPTSMQSLARGDLQGLLAAIVERAARLDGGDRGALYLATADGARLRIHISHNMGETTAAPSIKLAKERPAGPPWNAERS